MAQAARPVGACGVAYLRVSDPTKQDHNSQRQTIQAWLDKHELTVSLWLEDGGARDVAYRRPLFQKLLRLVEDNRVSWVVVDAQDRFGVANNWELGKFICHLREHNCELWSVSQGLLSSDDAFTSLMAAVGSVQSKHEQLDKAQRAIRGKIAQARAGTYVGGVPPYGFDVACYGPDGQEKWRVFYEGRFRRVQIWPDGHRERFDGEGNFPGRASKADVLRLAPSCDRQRVETAARIFSTFANEALSLRGLCHRLNALGVDPVIGQAWYTSRLGPMLRNPCFKVGQCCYNKNGHGRHLEWLDGEYKRVPRVNDRTKTGRKRAPEQFIYPEGQFQGIVDAATFDKVQAKLQGTGRSARAPRNRQLWLSGLLVCGHCAGIGPQAGRMIGWHQKSDKTCPYSYTCPSYRQYGASNPTGCRLHRVNARIIERLLERYLQEAGEGLEALLAASADVEGDGILVGLLEQQEGKQWDYMRELTRLWRQVKASGAKPSQGQPWAVGTLCETYRSQAAQSRAEIGQRLAAREAEMDRLVDQFAALRSSIARERANQKMEALEAEILALREQLRPLDEKVQGLWDDLKRLQGMIVEARETLAGDSNRRKAAAVRAVIRRIVCRFRYAQAGSQMRSILTEVRFEPVEGQAKTFVVDGGPGPGSPRSGRGGGRTPG
jgi:DNA invertase Pin-like site-specific DNA recombinase